MAPGGNDTKDIADRYKLVSPLGKGGMGRVWRAEDSLLQREVAVKEVELPPELHGDEREAMQARVLREARAAGRLNHPSVVTVYDVIRDDGKAYIVMELVDARTLGDIVSRDGPLAPERAADIGIQVLGALDRAHREGIVHRDVKPANVMVAPDGTVKLADFGIASLKGDPKITATGLVLGSPSFMAPEQAEGIESGPAADLWALGATLYYAVEGRPPFDKGRPLPTLASVVHDDPEPPAHGGSLQPLIGELLSKSPGRRPSARETHEMLERVASGGTSGIGGATGSATARFPSGAEPATGHVDETTRRGATPTPTRRPASTAGALRPSRPRRSRGAWLAAAALVALVGLLLFTDLRGDDPLPEGRDGARAERRDAGGEGRSGGGKAGQGPTSAGAVPANWAGYTDDAGGWAISYPSGWEVVPDSLGDGSSTDFRDPSTGAYLRVDWTTEPSGASPVEAWEDQSESFAQNHENYREIGIEPVTYKGMDAATWEFTYDDDGAQLHALDLGFVTQDEDFAGALFLNARDEDWGSYQDDLEAFKASFRPPR